MSDVPADEAINQALGRLEVLVGTWDITATFPGDPPTVFGGAQTTFEWTCGGRLLMQRTDMPADGPPSSLTLITYDQQTNTYRQHYYDSRGVIRLYEMTLDDQVWTLLRTEPDFSPLDFSQRFVGEISSDATTIAGAWEKASDEAWKHDFALAYTRR
jgi:uncharacterized protein DUF1579